MLNKARNQNYVVSRHTSDLIDGQQLIYLFDESVIFVTQDRNLREAAKATPQSNRVISFNELLQQCRG